MITEDGPYGVIEQELSPRWTRPVRGGKVTKVESWELGYVTGKTTKVRMVAPMTIAASKSRQLQSIDIDEEATRLSKTESRLLIKPIISKLRSRSGSDDFSPTNLIDFPQEELTESLDHLDKSTKIFRRALLNEATSMLMAYDTAAGETEAIVRDCLETEIEIDNELTDYIEQIGNANILAAAFGQCTHLPEANKEKVLEEFLLKAFDEIRIQHKSKGRIALMRRLQADNEHLVAKHEVGAIRNLAGRQNSNG